MQFINYNDLAFVSFYVYMGFLKVQSQYSVCIAYIYAHFLKRMQIAEKLLIRTTLNPASRLHAFINV